MYIDLVDPLPKITLTQGEESNNNRLNYSAMLYNHKKIDAN